MVRISAVCIERTAHQSLQVVLSASVCTRQGKALVSRQFVEMNRLRVEGLLAAFPKLVGHSQQHTYVETDSVRYVYQPLENQMYLLLITTKASNIVEDLGTLRLLAKVVPDVAGGLMESAINDHAFELIFAFDEVLTAGGYKEEASLSQIRTNLLMDSHEEKIQDALKEAKEAQARAEMEAKAKSLQEQHLRAKFSGAPSGLDTRMQGISGGGRPSSAGIFDMNAQQEEQAHNAYSDNVYAPRQPSTSVPDGPKVIAKSGMKLGGGGAKKPAFGGNALESMAKEDNLFQGMASKTNAFSDLGTSVQPVAAAPTTPLTLVLEEKVTVNMNREGSVEAAEVKGTLSLTANTDAGAGAVVSVDKPSGFTYATHPKVDKKVYEKDGLLALKGGKDFPVGKTVGILRWSYSGEDVAPLTINCWPEEEGSGVINVNIEMELTRKDLVLYDVNILLPLGTTEAPTVSEVDGLYKHDPREGMLCWHFDQVDANNASGSMEFQISGHDTDAFFPVQVGFRSEKLLCPINVLSVKNSGTGADIPHQKTSVFIPDSYQCA